MTAPLPGWPTDAAAEPAVRFAGAVAEGWTALGAEGLGQQVTARWSGAVAGEGLSVTLLTGATPDADLAGWLELPMSLVGVDPQTVPVPGTGEPLTWHEGPDLLATEDVDQAIGRSGLVRFTADGADHPELLRLYVLLARRGDVAWKVAYALPSAVPPGAADDVVEANDHVRARALFEALRLG